MSDALTQEPLTTPVPANESERLAALHRYKILDTPSEVAFDRITTLAARLFDAPIALISLVDESRAWFKSCIGFGAREVARDATLCSFAVLADLPLIVPDARLDARFACNPFVQAEPGVRFYAGAPLMSADGFNLGTLCLLDSQPRDPLTAAQQATLVDLAALVVDELELRLAAHKIAQVDAALVEITQGVATVTGEAFIEALVQHFARVLEMDYAYIGLIQGDAPQRLKTIATCAHGQIVENLDYLLQDTPCWEVIQQHKICCYPRNVQTEFPHAPLLQPLAIESYIAAPFFDSSGSPLGILGLMSGKPLENPQLAESLLTVFADRIATELERQQTEAALRQSEEKYRRLFESIDEGFSICEMLFDQNGQPTDYRFLEVNPAFALLTGLEAAAGKTARELVPNLEHYWIEGYGNLVQTGQPLRFEQQSIALNRWFDVSAFCIGEPQSNQFAVLFTNISGRKQVERERERFLALGSDMQVITGRDGYFQWVSPSVEQLLGWTVAEMTSRPWHEFVHPEDINRSIAEADNLFAGQISFAFENRYCHKDGSYRWLLWNAQSYAEEQVLYGAAVDITVRKQAELEREQLLQQEQSARTEAEKANRLKDEFLAVLSHELRSPLNPILGWTSLLKTGKLDANRQREALEIIERNAKLQTQLIEDLLDISRIMQGKMTFTAAPVQLGAVISAALDTVQLAAAAKNISISLELDPTTAPVSGDAARLQQVIWNLLTNAIKFTPSGGKVAIELRPVNQLAQIRVIDTGRGIQPQFLPHVFEYFRQEDGSTTRKFGGLGLGLAIVRQIVELHGGTVQVESPGEDQGTTLTVRLPMIQQHSSALSELAAAQPPVQAAPPGQPELLAHLQILVVDDDRDTREFHTFLLQQSGAKVTAADSGLAALQALDHVRPDLLVSDVGMAEMDGYMLIQQIRRRPPDQGGKIPAIALTAYARDFDQQKALRAGFQVHLTKPVAPEELVRAILCLVEQAEDH